MSKGPADRFGFSQVMSATWTVLGLRIRLNGRLPCLFSYLVPNWIQRPSTFHRASQAHIQEHPCLGGLESEIGASRTAAFIFPVAFSFLLIPTIETQAVFGYWYGILAAVWEPEWVTALHPYKKWWHHKYVHAFAILLQPPVDSWKSWNGRIARCRLRYTTVPLMMEVRVSQHYLPEETTAITAHGRFQSLAGHYRCAVDATQNMRTIRLARW